MRKIVMIGLLLIFASCKSKKLTADSPQRFVIENLAGVSSAEKMRDLYPNAKMEEGVDLFEEATVERAFTVLFPDTENRALITWSDKNRSQVHAIRVEDKGNWRTEEGIKIGTTYEELERLNGPFDFYGFGWDYSGAVNWKGGKLADSNIRVFLIPKGTPPNKFYGDRVIEPTEENLKELNLSVGAILYQKSLN